MRPRSSVSRRDTYRDDNVVLDFAETGDRLETLTPNATVLEAIHLFSGEASTRDEPPAALLVLDATKEHLPQLLCSRADLSLLYAQLEV